MSFIFRIGSLFKRGLEKSLFFGGCLCLNCDGISQKNVSPNNIIASRGSAFRVFFTYNKNLSISKLIKYFMPKTLYFVEKGSNINCHKHTFEEID